MDYVFSKDYFNNQYQNLVCYYSLLRNQKHISLYKHHLLLHVYHKFQIGDLTKVFIFFFYMGSSCVKAKHINVLYWLFESFWIFRNRIIFLWPNNHYIFFKETKNSWWILVTTNKTTPSANSIFRIICILCNSRLCLTPNMWEKQIIIIFFWKLLCF